MALYVAIMATCGVGMSCHVVNSNTDSILYEYYRLPLDERPRYVGEMYSRCVGSGAYEEVVGLMFYDLYVATGYKSNGNEVDHLRIHYDNILQLSKDVEIWELRSQKINDGYVHDLNIFLGDVNLAWNEAEQRRYISLVKEMLDSESCGKLRLYAFLGWTNKFDDLPWVLVLRALMYSGFELGNLTGSQPSWDANDTGRYMPVIGDLYTWSNILNCKLPEGF